MSTYNRQNIDRKTNKPNPKRTNSRHNDVVLNRAEQVRRDDDVIRTPKRTVYDIDYAIKWFIENEIQPQITHNNEIIKVPVIFANGEKWDNVRRLGYLRDEKGMLQSPLIVIKRNSVTERDQLRKLDVNKPVAGNQIYYKSKYNSRNRYEDAFFKIPGRSAEHKESEELYAINIPEYVDVSYDLMIWTDFTTQMNDMIEQFMPYRGMAWGNESNKFYTMYTSFDFETVNTVGEDRLVRATTNLTVKGTLMAEQEFRESTLKKAYSIKKVRFDIVVDVPHLFETINVPESLLLNTARLYSNEKLLVFDKTTGSELVITEEIMDYLTNITEVIVDYVNTTTVTTTQQAAVNPVTLLPATKNEFDIYINGQYADKATYTWTPASNTDQTIIFDPAILGYSLESDDVVIVKGRWK